MLKKTFCHTQGISQETEKLLWTEGIDGWSKFLENIDNITCIPRSKIEKIRTEILFSLEHLDNQNLSYFKEKLSPKEHHRLANYGNIAYVDIETTGLSKYTDDITMIGIYDGQEPRSYIKGKDLEDAYERLKEFDIIVTFNGKTFDMPFIEYKSKNRYDIVHLDLRFMLKELGLSGGLKKVEQELGISRDDEVAQVDGFEAVRLWRRYTRGDEGALRKLLIYNKEDIVNLKYLLEHYIEEKQKQLTPLYNFN